MRRVNYYQIEVKTNIFSPCISKGDLVYCSPILEINNNSFIHCKEMDIIMTYGEFKNRYSNYKELSLSKVVGVQGGYFNYKFI